MVAPFSNVPPSFPQPSPVPGSDVVPEVKRLEVWPPVSGTSPMISYKDSGPLQVLDTCTPVFKKHTTITIMLQVIICCLHRLLPWIKQVVCFILGRRVDHLLVLPGEPDLLRVHRCMPHPNFVTPVGGENHYGYYPGPPV